MIACYHDNARKGWRKIWLQNQAVVADAVETAEAIAAVVAEAAGVSQ